MTRGATRLAGDVSPESVAIGKEATLIGPRHQRRPSNCFCLEVTHVPSSVIGSSVILPPVDPSVHARYHRTRMITEGGLGTQRRQPMPGCPMMPCLSEGSPGAANQLIQVLASGPVECCLGCPELGSPDNVEDLRPQCLWPSVRPPQSMNGPN